MAVDSRGGWIGFGVGDVDPEGAPRDAPNWRAVSLINEKLYDRFSSVRVNSTLADRTKPIYDAATADNVAMIARNYGMAVPVDPQGRAIASLAFRRKIGAYPPPPPPKHAMLTVRGTGGIVDADPTSWVADNSYNHYEVPMLYAATMGGIPVAAANNINAPSGNECADELYHMLAEWVSTTTATFSIAAYSLATKGVHRFLNDLTDPEHSLFQHLSRLVSVVLIGDPWRPFGRSFYLGPVPAGQGIGTPYFTLSDRAIKTLGWRICWLTDPGDMYANSPLGADGEILSNIQEIILGMRVMDPIGTLRVAIPMLLETVSDAGVSLPGIGSGLLASATTGNIAGLGVILLPLLIGSFSGLVAGITGNGAKLPKGPAAAVSAAIHALKFFGSGIAGHVNYHTRPWGFTPQTYVDLGIQHANDWGRGTPVLV